MSNVEKFLEAGGVSQPLYTQNYVDKKDAEIERLKNDIKRITEITNQKIKIINDIREYIENNSYFESNVVKTMVFKDYSKGILEILDKVGDKE